MAFTPSPGTGDLFDVDPKFVDPQNGDFSLQELSPCIASGKKNYDRGAVWYVNRPLGVFPLQIAIDDTSTQITVSWDMPTVMSDSTALASSLEAKVFRNDSLISTLSGLPAGSPAQIFDSLDQPGNYEYSTCVSEPGGLEGIVRKTASRWGGGKLDGIVIWNMDPNPSSKNALIQSLTEIGYSKPVFETTDPNEYDLTQDVPAVFVFLGVQPNHYLLGEGGSNRLINYLSNGGNVYLEGGDFWSEPVQQSLAISQFFHINPVGPGQADLSQIQGVPESMMNGLSFNYSGENISIDDISNQSDSEIILRNPADGQGCAVAYNGFIYRTIGASFQFGGMENGNSPNSRTEYLQRVFGFFSVPVKIDNPYEVKPALAKEIELHQNFPNPFNNSTTISFGLTQKSRLTLEIFSVLGQKLLSRYLGEYRAGTYRVGIEFSELNSGMYFYRIKSADEKLESRVRKFILVK